jgi:hypothetical protein
MASSKSASGIILALGWVCLGKLREGYYAGIIAGEMPATKQARKLPDIEYHPKAPISTRNGTAKATKKNNDGRASANRATL